MHNVLCNKRAEVTQVAGKLGQKGLLQVRCPRHTWRENWSRQKLAFMRTLRRRPKRQRSNGEVDACRRVQMNAAFEVAGMFRPNGSFGLGRFWRASFRYFQARAGMATHTSV